MSRIVIALGGNALGNNPLEQQERAAVAAESIMGLIREGHEVIVSHGNGPQVGMINMSFDIASSHKNAIPKVELQECTAMSQGYIGYHLQKAIKNMLKKNGLSKEVVSLITQVVVSKSDKAFDNPTKPIGSFYTEELAKLFMENNPNECYAEDAGRGWRRMVPSPKPIDILEKKSITTLVDNGFLVIASGGGGIPVIQNASGEYEGVSAVIDKDFATAKLAEIVNADYLFILTAVDRVSINWGKPEQMELELISVKDAKRYCIEGHFAPGSMLPKVQAAISFASSGLDKKAVIASLENASLAIKGESGTVIKADALSYQTM